MASGLANEWKRTKELIRRLILAWKRAQEATTTEDERSAIEDIERIVEEMKYVNDQYFGQNSPDPLDDAPRESITGTPEQRTEIQTMAGGYRYKTPKNRRKSKSKTKTKSKSPSKSKKTKKSRRKSKY